MLEDFRDNVLKVFLNAILGNETGLQSDQVVMKFAILVNLLQAFLPFYDECPQILFQLGVDLSLVY